MSCITWCKKNLSQEILSQEPVTRNLSQKTCPKENHYIFKKKIPFKTPIFLLCSSFHARPTTLLFKILGGPMHGPSPTSNFFGGPFPPRSPPLFTPTFLHC